jgi:hypothetical protein
MDRDFRTGHIEIDFPTEPFDSVFRLLFRSAGLFFSNLPFIAAVTLAVCLPAKLLLQFVCYLLDVPAEGILSYILIDISDLILSALFIPAIVYGLATKFRTGKQAPIRESLRWGRRQWGKTLWNKFKVEITIALWGALLIIPGVVAMVKLIFTDVIVAIEGDHETEVLQRSRDLSHGHRWRIFLVLLPVMVIDLVASYFVLSALREAAYSRLAMAFADSALSVGGQWTTVVILLMYLGLAAPPSQPPPAAPAKTKRALTPRSV